MSQAAHDLAVILMAVGLFGIGLWIGRNTGPRR